MPAINFDFTKSSCQNPVCEQGATFTYQFLWQKETTPGSDVFVPVDLTGFTAKMQVRKKAGDPVILELSTANSRITLGGIAGTIDLLVAANITDALVPGMYKYDLEITTGAGVVTRFVEGLFEVVGQITT